MPFLKRLADWAQQVLLPLGPWGLFAAAVLDSSFLPMPGGVDVWLISVCALNPSRMPLYVVATIAGSVAGSSMLYLVVGKGREKLLERNPKYYALPSARRWVERYGPLALVVAAVFPPPAPFKMVVAAAAVLKHPFLKFALALLLGRSIRYVVEGVLAVRFGRQAWQWITTSGTFLLALVAIIVVMILLTMWLRRKALLRVDQP